MRVTPNHRNLTEMPFGQIMPSWTVAMEGVQLQYLVLTSEYKAQFFPSCLKCFAFILENFSFVCASAVQYLWVERRPNLAPILRDQFYWTNSTDSVSSTDSTNPTGPILLAYDFF